MTTETMWRCDQVRAGRLYNRMTFDTREEAEQFMNRMRQMEPGDGRPQVAVADRIERALRTGRCHGQ